MPNWIDTNISVIIGSLLTLLASWLADRRQTKRDRERRHDERQGRLMLRHNDFQRETLLALQVASQALLRNTGASWHADVMESRRSGKWQKQPLPNSLSDDHLRLVTEVTLLASRVHDDEVRSLADKVRTTTTDVIYSSNESEAQDRIMSAVETQQLLVERIGEIVRQLDKIS